MTPPVEFSPRTSPPGETRRQGAYGAPCLRGLRRSWRGIHSGVMRLSLSPCLPVSLSPCLPEGPVTTSLPLPLQRVGRPRGGQHLVEVGRRLLEAGEPEQGQHRLPFFLVRGVEESFAELLAPTFVEEVAVIRHDRRGQRLRPDDFLEAVEPAGLAPL